MPNGTKQVSPQPDLIQLAEFFRALHGNKPPNLFFYTWHLDSKQSLWHADVESVIDHFHTASPALLTNLYTGVAWSPDRKSGGQRVRSTDAAGVSGTWLDLDIAHAVAHKKGSLPPDIKTAHDLVLSWAPTPTITIESGHGLQYWWLFDEPWIVTSDADRKRLQALIQGWQTAIMQLFAAHGWQVDSTHDLARVMRVPGTINAKPGCEPVLAVLDSVHNDARYDPTALMARVEQMPGMQASLTPQQIEAATGHPDYDSLEVKLDADVPSTKLTALQEADPKFRAIWLRKSKGGGDDSTSGWDEACACHAALAGWKPQEIVNLLVAYRRLYHCEDRPDSYYRMTVEKAFRFVAGSEAQLKLNDLASVVAQGNDLPSHEREGVIEAIKERLGVRIDRIQKFGEFPVKYVFTIDGVESAAVPTRGVLSYKSVEEAIFDAANRPPPQLKLAHWHPILQLLTHLVEIQPYDAELSPEAQGALWVEKFLSRRQVYTDPSEAITAPGVLNQDGSLWVSSADFRAWLLMEHREIRREEITRNLVAMNAIPQSVPVVLGGRRTHRTFWRLPGRFNDKLDRAQETAADDDSSLI